MDRLEHLAWCKTRALEYVESGDLPSAVASMTSDMGKHPENAVPPHLAMMGILEIGHGRDAVRRWIEGFN